MTNSYLTVDALSSKGALDISGSDKDTILRLMIESASRAIDLYTGRHFYTFNATRKLDGDGSGTLYLPDLISIDTDGLKTDDNKDRTFEVTWATTDYLLQPSNADPTGGHDQSGPYRSVIVDPAGREDVFTLGVQTVQIAGQWGYARRLVVATETSNEAMDATEIDLDVSSRTDIEAGHTILIGTEQMYVQSYATNTLTVIRGVNGTTATTHLTGQPISIYLYPSIVAQAAQIQVSRLWKRKDSAFANTIGFPSGQMQIFNKADPDYKQLLGGVRSLSVGMVAV